MVKKIFISLIILLSLPILGNADPSITSISGSIADGTSVVISGASFGTHSLDIEWLGGSNGNIEQGTDGAGFSKTKWFSDSDSVSRYQPRYSTERAHSGTKSIISQYPDQFMYDSGFSYDYGSEFDIIYASWWVYFHQVDSKGQWKKWRLSPTSNYNNADGEIQQNDWIDGSSSYFILFCDSSNYYPCYPNGDSRYRYISTDTKFVTGMWIRYELFGIASSVPGVRDGSFLYRIHKQNVGVKTITLFDDSILDWQGNIITRANDVTAKWRYLQFINYWGNISEGNGTKEKIYIDDIYIQIGSRAHIEIGDNAIFTDCTHREIQVPSEWKASGDSITITVNQGSFADGENVYLFVVDADGIPSAGYGPITIGSGEKGDDTTPPGDVTDLTKQVGDGQVVLNWINPVDSDFKGTMIRYRTDGTYPANNSDGIEVCNKTALPGTSDTHTLTGLTNGTTYYFSAFTYDETGNYSKAAHISATPFHCANVYTKTFGDISGADFPQTCKDTYLNAGEAEVTYSSNSESLNTYTWPTNTAANRIVMKWDLSALPQDVIIQEATLSLYMHDYGGDDNYEITAHKIINHNPDISSCTWNTYDSTNSWTGGANGGEQDIASAESSTIVDKTFGYKNWDITQMVREWVNNPSENYGLMLNSDATAASDSNRYFRPTEYSSQEQRPVLTIKYGSSDIPKVPSAPSGLGVSVISE